MDRAYAEHVGGSGFKSILHTKRLGAQWRVPVTPALGLGDRDECILKACCLDQNVSFQFGKRSYLSAVR